LQFLWLSGLLSSPGGRGCNLNCHSRSSLWVWHGQKWKG
jgi:hypothetical protein